MTPHSPHHHTRTTPTNEVAPGVQGANRGGVSNIARTAAKLPPFAFNDARLAAPPPLRHLMQAHVRGAPPSKQLTPAVEQASLQDRQTLCDVCRKPYHRSLDGSPRERPCKSPLIERMQPRACQSCAHWVLPEASDGSDAEDAGGSGAGGSARGTGESLAWLADAMPRLELT